MAQRRRLVARKNIPDGKDVAERLRHLLLVDVEKAVVHPRPRERQAVGRLGLRDLVLVMRKDQVAPAAVQVEGLA